MRFIKLSNKLSKRHEQLTAAGCVFQWISEQDYTDYDLIDFDDTCSTTTKFRRPNDRAEVTDFPVIGGTR